MADSQPSNTLDDSYSHSPPYVPSSPRRLPQKPVPPFNPIKKRKVSNLKNVMEEEEKVEGKKKKVRRNIGRPMLELARREEAREKRNQEHLTALILEEKIERENREERNRQYLKEKEEKDERYESDSDPSSDEDSMEVERDLEVAKEELENVRFDLELAHDYIDVLGEELEKVEKKKKCNKFCCCLMRQWPKNDDDLESGEPVMGSLAVYNQLLRKETNQMKLEMKNHWNNHIKSVAMKKKSKAGKKKKPKTRDEVMEQNPSWSKKKVDAYCTLYLDRESRKKKTIYVEVGDELLASAEE